MTLPVRIVEKIAMGAECWLWLGAVSSSGYGRTTMNGRGAPAHRVVYEALLGPIPDGMTLDHLCRNRLCVRPDHLEPVTMRENTLRGVGPTAVNAAKTHCAKGHPLSGDNLGTLGPDGKWRRCRTCLRQTQREWARAKYQAALIEEVQR